MFCLSQSRRMEIASCLVHTTRRSECGIWRLARHWVPLSKGTPNMFALSQSRRMENASCLVHLTRRSGCGIWRLVRHWLPLSKGTLKGLALSQSRRMEVASCLDHLTTPSGCGMLNFSNRTTPSMHVQYVFHPTPLMLFVSPPPFSVILLPQALSP